MRITVVAFFAVAALALAACKPDEAPSNTPEPGPSSPASDDAGEGADTSDEPLVAATAGKELPESLLAELRLQGSDANGRLVTLASGFIATAACSDCGAPSYLWFVAVRCTDGNHCEVLTEVCEGKIARAGDTFVLEFHAVDGGPAEGAEVCAGYTGTFERP